jgi:hypothetical protein
MEAIAKEEPIKAEKKKDWKNWNQEISPAL